MTVVSTVDNCRVYRVRHCLALIAVSMSSVADVDCL